MLRKYLNSPRTQITKRILKSNFFAESSRCLISIANINTRNASQSCTSTENEKFRPPYSHVYHMTKMKPLLLFKSIKR